MNGIVTKSTGSWYQVKINNKDFLECRLRGKFRTQKIKSTNPVVVGDKVVIEKIDQSYMITDVLDRKNCIIRRSVNLSKKTHVIAANIDQAILMITLEKPETTTTFIDRFLVAAEAYNIKVILLFNKMDIYNNRLILKQEELQNLYHNIGYQTAAISVLQDDLSLVREFMKGKINMISGHSGVGKSTLINELQPNLNIETKEISDLYHQGKHTTTFSELYELDFGASIIDTPGIKGFGLVEIDTQSLSDHFPEFFNLRDKCKYHNCIHINEPKCAVRDAIIGNRIDKSRYLSYLGMIEEDDIYRINDY